MLRKILVIAWNGIYRTYTDRTAVMLMFLVPIALSTIIGLAFGSGSSDIELESPRLLVINQDEGAALPDGTPVQQGQQYVDILVSHPPQELADLIAAESSTDIEAARQQVEDGDARAVLIIPPDFSSKVLTGEGQIELYYNPAAEIGATILISVVEQITASLNIGQAAQDVLVGENGYFIEQGLANDKVEVIGEAASAALTPIFSGQQVSQVRLNSVNVKGDVQEFDSLRYFAPSMAILFMTFAMAGGTRSILEERRNGTLARLMTTPTPRWVYMLGRLLGTYGAGVLQMAILLLITPLIAVMLGREASVWGNNYIGIALITLAVVSAATGLGLLLSAFSKTPEQADNLSSAVLIVLAILGGTFVPVDGVPVLDMIKNASLNYWGVQGYNDLANNNAPLGDVLPNIGILFLMAAVFFMIALWNFNKRLDI